MISAKSEVGIYADETRRRMVFHYDHDRARLTTTPIRMSRSADTRSRSPKSAREHASRRRSSVTYRSVDTASGRALKTSSSSSSSKNWPMVTRVGGRQWMSTVPGGRRSSSRQLFVGTTNGDAHVEVAPRARQPHRRQPRFDQDDPRGVDRCRGCAGTHTRSDAPVTASCSSFGDTLRPRLNDRLVGDIEAIDHVDHHRVVDPGLRADQRHGRRADRRSRVRAPHVGGNRGHGRRAQPVHAGGQRAGARGRRRGGHRPAQRRRGPRPSWATPSACRRKRTSRSTRSSALPASKRRTVPMAPR
jgi:hypothetical protein